MMKQLPFLFLVSYIISLYFYEFAKAWLSISMIGFVLTVILTQHWKKIWSNFIAQKSFLAISLSAGFMLLSYLNSENHSYFFQRIEIKLPIMLMPIAMAGLVGELDKRKYIGLIALFILGSLFSAFYSLILYYQQFDLINESYLKAQVMPTLINHVRFSIMVAFSCYLAYYLYKTKIILWYSWESKIWLIISIFLFAFIHVFSVRSGLMAIYAALCIEIFYYFKKDFQWKTFIIGSLLFLSTMAITFRFVPTLHNKFENTKADFQTYFTKGYPNFSSITTRLISYEAAMNIFSKQPIFGCGLGDIKDESDLYFKKLYPQIETPILPHNQFLFVLSSMGIIGLAFFITAFYWPLKKLSFLKNQILFIHYLIITISALSEPLLETQLGVGFVVLFLLLPLTQKAEEHFSTSALTA